MKRKIENKMKNFPNLYFSHRTFIFLNKWKKKIKFCSWCLFTHMKISSGFTQLKKFYEWILKIKLYKKKVVNKKKNTFFITKVINTYIYKKKKEKHQPAVAEKKQFSIYLAFVFFLVFFFGKLECTFTKKKYFKWKLLIFIYHLQTN